MNNFQIANNFKLKEFESPDTKEVKIKKELVKKLQLARDRFGAPIYITSGYRTHEHNLSVDGHPFSRHMDGCAVDVTVYQGTLEKLFHICLQLGFEKVLIYEEKNFLHVQIKRG